MSYTLKTLPVTREPENPRNRETEKPRTLQFTPYSPNPGQLTKPVYRKLYTLDP